MFESIYITKNQKQDSRGTIFILGASTKRQSNLRVKPIVESEIGFLLELYRYSSE